MGKNKKHTYINVYKKIYDAHINGGIKEHIYIASLQKLTMAGMKTYHIDKYYEMISFFYDKQLFDSFNISMLLYIRDLIHRYFASISLFFADIRDIFIRKDKNAKQKINDIQELLNLRKTILKSFRKYEPPLIPNKNINHYNYPKSPIDGFLSSPSENLNKTYINKIYINKTYINKTFNNKILSNTQQNITKPNITKPNITSEKIYEHWERATKGDFIERLHLLAYKHYTIEELKFMEVTLKYASEINEMSYDRLQNYYDNTINTIDNKLSQWLHLCTIYLLIDANYVDCCDNINLNKPTYLHFDVNTMIDNIKKYNLI